VSVLVRPVLETELTAVGALTVAAYQPFLLGPDDPYAVHLADARARFLEAELLVAVADGSLVGTVTLCREGSPWREIGEADEGEFRMLAVSPAAQGQGVGSALVGYCLDRFRESGASAVVLSSLTEMRGAHRIYERLGFTRLPERDWSPSPGVGLIAYRKELG
jgi:ribosomal protein S18 acetylase RimI-like enzyme